MASGPAGPVAEKGELPFSVWGCRSLSPPQSIGPRVAQGQPGVRRPGFMAAPDWLPNGTIGSDPSARRCQGDETKAFLPSSLSVMGLGGSLSTAQAAATHAAVMATKKQQQPLASNAAAVHTCVRVKQRGTQEYETLMSGM